MDNETTQRILGLLSHLLQYPDYEWREQLLFVREEAELLQGDMRQTLLLFLDTAQAANGLEWQDRYVQTFDFGKRSNLYLTYDQHGEDRERGPALLELKRRYSEAGFVLETSELPDYLPLMLEFASAAPWEAAQGVLAGKNMEIASIHRQLEEAGSPYAGLIALVQTFIPDPPPMEQAEPSAALTSEAMTGAAGKGRR